MIADLLYRLRALLRRERIERELDDELQFHLEQQTAKYTRAGFSPGEANRLARVALNGPEQTKERCRDARGLALWDATMQDLRYAVRQFKGAPAFSAVVIAVLALGIGANTAIFSLLDAVMLRSLPVRDPQQLLVARWTANATPHPYGYSSFDACFASRAPGAEGGCSFTYPAFKLIQSKQDIFSQVTAFAGPARLNVESNGPAAVVSADIVSGSFFQTLGVPAALGRTLVANDDAPSAPATVVLSFGYWQNAFAGDPSAIGKVIRLNAVPFTVIGVAGPAFNQLSPGTVCDMWLPIHAATTLGLPWISANLDDEHNFWLELIGRARQGVTAARAQSVLTALLRNEMVRRSKILKPDSGLEVEVAPAQKALTGIREMLAKPLYILMFAVGLILLITCTNIAGLMTARVAARQREIAIRLSLGAGRGRILRQLLTESLLLAASGGLAGLGVAWAVTRWLTSFLPVPLDVRPDVRIFLFAAAVSLGSGLFFGVLPALRITRKRRGAEFQTASEGLQNAMSSAARRRWFSNSLVIAQVALAAVMLFGAGLFMRTLLNLESVNVGFNPRSLLLFGLDPVSLRYKDAQIQTLYRSLQARLASLPGITGVTYSSTALLSGSLSGSDYVIEGRSDRRTVPVHTLSVGPAFFDTMGIPLLEGRAFSAAEFANARPVALVNRAFIKEYLAGRPPLGVRFGDDSSKAVQNEIIGVVADAKYNNLRDAVKPTAYMPLRGGGGYFELRTAGNARALLPSIRKIVRELDPNLPVADLKTQSQSIDDTLVTERLLAWLSTAFGLLALTLACVGVYGLLSYEVSRRTREIGIRMAVGAAPAIVRRAVLRETLAIAAVGLLFGIPAALVSTRAVSAMLYGIPADDPVTAFAIVSALVAISGLAGYIPARRASRVDPAVALRSL